MRIARNKLNRFAQMALSRVIPRSSLDGNEGEIILNMVLHHSVYERMERLKVRSDAHTLVELFQVTFATYEMILDCALRGDKIIAKGRDDVELELGILRYE